MRGRVVSVAEGRALTTLLLNVKEAAERLRVSDWTLRRMVRDGLVPVVRLTPGKLLFDPADLQQAIEHAKARPAEAEGVAHAGGR
jgi:excisionase family DNA binding protein